MSDDPALAGFRIGVTAARKAEEQVALLERRGATVTWAPALSADPHRVDEASLRATTEQVLAGPVDLFIATTGVGMKAWFEAAEEWGLLDRLLEALGAAQILARGPKSVGALRARGLRERWSPESEELDDVLQHLQGRDLSGQRIVVQEHGQALVTLVQALRRQGAVVEPVTVYRLAAAHDPSPLYALVDLVADRQLDAVTFTSAPAIAAFMEAAASTGRRDAVLTALRTDVVACCVGPVTAAAFAPWNVPTTFPDRSRTGAMVKHLETALPTRRVGLSRRLVVVAHGTRNPTGNLVAARIAQLAGERCGVEAEVSYVELCEPLLGTDLARRVEGASVVVPLLLTTGYHVRVDIPEAVASAYGPTMLSAPLGPDPLLARAQAERLAAAGARRGQPVTMIAAGSNDPAAQPDLERAADLLAREWGAPVRLATLSGAGQRPQDVVRPGDAVSPYLLAEGYFATRCAELARAAGASVVADVIGAHDDVVDIVAARFLEAQARADR